jgi:glycosyltransferase involved in cell wall biosynthesis
MLSAMKIDLIITELAVGGAEQCLTNLALHLRQHLHSVRVLTLGRPPDEGRDRLLERLEEQNIEVRFLGGRSWWHLPWVLARLWRAIRSSPPEIAQSFLFHANVSAAILYPFFKVPLVGGARVVDPRRGRRWLNWLSSKTMNRLVCVSQSVAEHSRNYDKVDPKKIVVIANGIRIVSAATESPDESIADAQFVKAKSYSQRQLGIASTTPCLLFVGRLDHQKGVDVLLTHADEILSALPLHQIIFIGDGPMKSQLQTQASHCKHENRIHFVGRREDVALWMQSCQLLLLPTRYEGMPNVVLEAMSFGLPIISTQAEGVLELLGDAAAEQTVAVGDWDAWSQKVIDVAANIVLHQKLSKVNLDRCVQYFDLNEKMQQYEMLYREVLNESSPPSPLKTFPRDD